MENVTQEIQTPEEKATLVFEEAMSKKDNRLTLAEGEEMVASYDFPTASGDACTHEVFLTTLRFVHVEKHVNKDSHSKKINAFAISEVECIDSVLSRRKEVKWALVVVFFLLAVASAIVGFAVIPYVYAGCGVFVIIAVLTIALTKEKRTFSLLISGLSEHRQTYELLSLGVVSFKDVDGDEIESGTVEVLEKTETDILDGIVSEIGAKILEIKEGRV